MTSNEASFYYWSYYVFLVMSFLIASLVALSHGIESYQYESLQTLEMYLFVLFITSVFWEGIWRPPLPRLMMFPLQILVFFIGLQLSVSIAVKLFAWRRI